MDDREELVALRRLAELEAKAGERQQPTPQVAEKVTPIKPLTNDNPNFIDKFLLDKFGGALAKAPDIQGSIPGRVIQGAAELPLGAMQLGLNAVGQGDAVNKRLADIHGRTEALRGPDANTFDWARLAGNVGTGAMLGLPAAAGKTVMGRIGQNAAIGAGLGASSPVTDGGENYWSDVGAHAVIGAGLGAGISGGVEGVKGAYKIGRNVVQPWLPDRRGMDMAVGRTLNKVAGSDREAIIAEMLKPDLVPGSMPGAGEKAANIGRTEFSALQEAVKGRDPTPWARQARAQEGARQAHIGAFAGDRQKLADALKARGEQANEAYGAVRGDRINLQSESDLLARPSVVEGLRDAALSAKERGQTFPPIEELTVGNLQRVKESLDAGIKASQSKTVAGIKPDLSPRELMETKRRLVDALSEKSPGWKTARQDFAEASRGTNQMEIGQELQKRLTDATGKQTAGKFLSAVDERTDDAVTKLVKNAVTGKPRYTTLDEALSPQNAKATRDVVADALRSVKHEQNTGAGAQRAREIIGQIAPKVPAAGMFSPHYSVMRAVLNRIGGLAEGKSLDRLNEIMRDPKMTAKLMKEATPSERALIASEWAGKGARFATIAAALGAAQGD